MSWLKDYIKKGGFLLFATALHQNVCIIIYACIRVPEKKNLYII